MENNDNLKSPQTGGLKLMTVFIAVLALHVVVIGGITVYHLMSGGNTDADFVTDKTHKGLKIATDDGSMPDASATDKSAASPSASASSSPAPAAPAPDASATADAGSTSVASPAPVPIPPAPAASTPAPAPDSTASAAANPPSGPLVSGPVVTPSAPPATTPETSDATTEAVAPPTALDADQEAGIPYTVKPHDSLARIAHRNHITLAQLRAANSLKSDLLQIGQKLVIPARTETASAEPAKDSAPAAASSGPDRTLLGDSIPEPTKKTVASTSHDEALVLPAAGGRHTYTVLKGDTLSKIAHKFHTTTSALMAANGSVDARKLRIGQKLRIPSQEPRSANSAPVAVPVQREEQQQPEPIEPRATPSAELANFMP